MSRINRAIGFRVTARDLEIVRWVGRLRMASAAQVAARFGVGRAVGYARLSGLVRMGLLEHTRMFHGTAGVYTATRSGLATVDLELPQTRIDVRTYDHDLQLSSLVVKLEREFGCGRLATEREMRSADTRIGGTSRAEPRFAVPLSAARGQLALAPGGGARLHFADCAITSPDNEAIIAIELERTRKGRPRLRQILSSYVAARHVRGVRYFATDDQVHAAVDAEVAGLGAERLVTVHGFGGGAASLADRVA